MGISEAANFASDFVMRVSAPSWSGGGVNAITALDKTIKDCMATADKNTVTSICFPSIGSGGYVLRGPMECALALSKIDKLYFCIRCLCLSDLTTYIMNGDLMTVD